MTIILESNQYYYPENEGATINYIDYVPSKLQRRMEKYERKIDRISERISQYEWLGKNTDYLEQRLDLFSDLLDLAVRYSSEDICEEIALILLDNVLEDWKYVMPLSRATKYEGDLDSTMTNDDDDDIHSYKEEQSSFCYGNIVKVEDLSDENFRKAIGDAGEEIALNFFNETLSKEIKSVAHITSKGYDLEWRKTNKTVGFEIKTTITTENSFYISENELRKAKDMREDYHIFFIKLKPKLGVAEGILITNPFQVLKPVLGHLEKILDEDYIRFPGSVEVRLPSSIIENQEKHLLVMEQTLIHNLAS